jgi:hypothetical protein
VDFRLDYAATIIGVSALKVSLIRRLPVKG